MAKVRSDYTIYTPIRSVFIIGVCILGMGGSIMAFREDFNRAVRQQAENRPIGSVYWVSGTVQRFAAVKLHWDRLTRHTSIYYGDIVKTAAYSEVKIRLNDGETLELSENTTIRIMFREGEDPFIELNEGEIHVQSNRSDLEIAMPSKNVPVVNGTLGPRSSACVKAADRYSSMMFQGSGVFTARGETRAAAAGEAVRVGKDGQFLPAPPLVMLSPRNGTRILRSFDETAQVKFTWKKHGASGGSVRLDISDSRDFSQLLGRWHEDASDSLDVSLPLGTYYWRAYVNPSAEAADSGRFDIVHAAAPRAVSPANGSVETIYPGKQNVRFSWTVPEEAEAVLLEVAANPEMNRPRLRQLIRKTDNGTGFFVTSQIGPGRWHWRIHPVYPGGVEGDMGFWRVRPMNAGIIADERPSPVNSFSLVASDELPFVEAKNFDFALARRGIKDGGNSSLRLLFPPDNYTIEAGRSPDTIYAWINPFSHTVRLQIAERPDFSGTLVADLDVSGSHVQGPYLRPGIYYWRITGAGDASSQPTRLVVLPSLPAPKQESPSDNERIRIEDTSTVNFTWERLAYADNYIFCLYLDERDSPLTEVSALPNNSVLVSFDRSTTGRFRWTVQGVTSATEYTSRRTGLIAESSFIIASAQGIGQDGQVAWSIPRIANIQTYSGEIYSPITLVSPASGTNYTGIEALRTPPTAQWTSREPVRNVQLIISRAADPSSDPRAIVLDARSSSVTFPALGEGIWYWTIRGDTSDRRGATPGSPFWINVLPIPLLASPRPIQPADRAVIDIAQLTRDRNITFRWGEVPGANAYIFSLIHNENPPAVLITSPAERSFTYVLENLSILQDGRHLWQVEAVFRNANGDIEQRGRIEQHPFTIEIQQSSNLQTQSVEGTLYGQ
ncbi:MAG: FecR family protein [Treponema sp.]|nr:FecR family protein [Treponema sp.]